MPTSFSDGYNDHVHTSAYYNPQQWLSDDQHDWTNKAVSSQLDEKLLWQWPGGKQTVERRVWRLRFRSFLVWNLKTWRLSPPLDREGNKSFLWREMMVDPQLKENPWSNLWFLNYLFSCFLALSIHLSPLFPFFLVFLWPALFEHLITVFSGL